MEGGIYSGYSAPYGEQDNYDQDNYHMPSDVGPWYAAQGVQMDPTRASSRRQGHFSSQEYHSGLDSIGEYATNPAEDPNTLRRHHLMRAHSIAAPLTRNRDTPADERIPLANPDFILRGYRLIDEKSPFMDNVFAAVDRLAPSNTELGSNWPYANSKLCPVQDADFSVNSDA